MSIESRPNEDQVLATALENLKDRLNISNNDMSAIIGVHHKLLSRSLQNKKIKLKNKARECTLLLIQIYRSLFALNGGNVEAMRHWLKTNNRHIQAVPLESMKTVLGLSRVVHYLDAIKRV